MKEKKQVCDHTRAEYGGVKQKTQLQNKKDLQYSSQRAEKPRVEGQEASCGLWRTLPTPNRVNLIAKSTMLHPGL